MLSMVKPNLQVGTVGMGETSVKEACRMQVKEGWSRWRTLLVFTLTEFAVQRAHSEAPRRRGQPD